MTKKTWWVVMLWLNKKKQIFELFVRENRMFKTNFRPFLASFLFSTPTLSVLNLDSKNYASSQHDNKINIFIFFGETFTPNKMISSSLIYWFPNLRRSCKVASFSKVWFHIKESKPDNKQRPFILASFCSFIFNHSWPYSLSYHVYSRICSS